MSLIEKIEDRTAKICVIGLGYVGLPLVKQFLMNGFKVDGVDTDVGKTRMLHEGKSYIESVGSLFIWDHIQRGTFNPNTIMPKECDVVVICVPTPLTESRDPDLQYVKASAEMVAKHADAGTLVVLESTTYPTTTRDIIEPIVSRYRPMMIAYSPEREDPGNPNHSIGNTPKVVGGITQESCEAAAALYSTIVPEVIQVSSCEVAEACKILENTYRAVNIALVNELKTLYDKMGINIWEVIDAAKTKPFGFQSFYPGPGLGGHCLPCDPFYLSWLARTQGMDTRFIELAGEINRSMPKYVVQRTMEFLNEQSIPMKNANICVVGLAYKKNVADPRESPSFEIIEELLRLGANVSYHDKLLPDLPKMRNHLLPDMQSQELTEKFLQDQSVVIISTDHDYLDFENIVEHANLVVDTRNCCPVSSRVRKT